MTAASDEGKEDQEGRQWRVSPTQEILLRHHLKKLKLPMVLREHEKMARQCAAEGPDPVRNLARLIEREFLDREARMIDRRIKAAKFPALKTLESFDFDALPGFDRDLVLDLARGEFVARRENIIALGPERHRQHPCLHGHRPHGVPTRHQDPLCDRRWARRCRSDHWRDTVRSTR